MKKTLPIPSAVEFDILFCGTCPNAHLVFIGIDGVALAQATMSAKQARMIIDGIRKRDPNFKEVVVDDQ